MLLQTVADNATPCNHSEFKVGLEGCCHQVFVLIQVLVLKAILGLSSFSSKKLFSAWALSDAGVIPQTHHLVLHELEVKK